MRVIIGYGNKLRGEDGFGIDVIEALQKQELPNTKLLSTMQLTPEIVLELLEATHIVFVDAAFSQTDHYALACSREIQKDATLSHHIAPQTILMFLSTLYEKEPTYEIFSMLSANFDTIEDKRSYQRSLNAVVAYLSILKS
ncbi:MAG: hydrogenase maturation protease [Sulfurimonas sp.]|nr:hydrogenase maturation protease [Sulfurimonas sp.]